MAVRTGPDASPKVPEIRKGDTVVVLAGKDAGKRGKVERVVRRTAALELDPAASSARGSSEGGTFVVVEGLNIAKRHTKPRQSAGSQRPGAEDAAGRDPRDRPAAAGQPGDARLLELRQADPDRAMRRWRPAGASGSAVSAASSWRSKA